MSKMEEIKVRLKYVKSCDYSYVVQHLDEDTIFDGTSIKEQIDDLINSAEYLISLNGQKDAVIKRLKGIEDALNQFRSEVMVIHKTGAEDVYAWLESTTGYKGDEQK